MKSILSLLAVIGGLWLLYLGHERQQSLAGKADSSLSKLGQSVDGGDHTPTHVKYYFAGAVLLAGGAIGIGIVRK
jgi:hypothetical protein